MFNEPFRIATSRTLVFTSGSARQEEGEQVNNHTNPREKGYRVVTVRANASSIYVSLCDPPSCGRGKEVLWWCFRMSGRVGYVWCGHIKELEGWNGGWANNVSEIQVRRRRDDMPNIVRPAATCDRGKIPRPDHRIGSTVLAFAFILIKADCYFNYSKVCSDEVSMCFQVD